MPYNIKGATYEITTNLYKIFGNRSYMNLQYFLDLLYISLLEYKKGKMVRTYMCDY